MARMGCSETAAHVLGRGMCHRADTERALCATVGGDSRAVIGKRDDKTRGDCLGACVCVCVYGSSAVGKRVLPMLLRNHRQEPKTQRNFGTVTKTVLLFLLLSSAWGTLRY